MAGCASTLAPAPEANRLDEHAAIAASGGVRVLARTEAWRGTPADPDGDVTPILITITNESERAIRVDYGELRLIGSDGGHYRALPLSRIGRERHPSPYFFGAPLSTGTVFWVHPAYWNTLEPALPTDDMRRKALPEGMLEPGESAGGFVYFEHLPSDARRVVLRAEFRGPGGARAARLHIPFEMS